MTGLSLMRLLHDHLNQNLQLWLHLLLVNAMFMLSAAMPFLASQCQLTPD